MAGKINQRRTMRSLAQTGLSESKVIKAEELAALNHPFFITNAVSKRGSFGEQVRFSIVSIDPDTGDEKERILFLAMNERRQGYVDDFLVNDEPIGLLVLGKIETDKGNPAWTFEDYSPEIE